MAKRMTPSEEMVGRRLPPYPKHIDTVMAGFVRDGEFRQCLPPSEDFLKPAFRQARKKGWLRATNLGISFMGSRAEYYWQVSDKGQPEALAAAERVATRNAERKQWSDDWLLVHKGLRKAANEAAPAI